MRRRSTFVLVSLAVLTLSSKVLPADEVREDVPVTDAALLESLGFAPDATNVYATAQAYGSLRVTPFERAAAEAARASASAVMDAGRSFGSNLGYTTVPYAAFFPAYETGEYVVRYGIRSCASGPSFYQAVIDSLPHGAKLRDVTLWLWDESAEDLRVSLVRTCHSDEVAGEQTFTILNSYGTDTDQGHVIARMGTMDEDVDRESCSYVLRARFDEDSAICSEGPALGIAKARVEWERQVGPAPTHASYGDVPTGHLFFRHIEALAASGITAGCGGGDFCPDRPLTRGQMAVFLAKALGLHWDEISQ